ncbi:hypothetical protein L1049_019135 [Liquidambar formosana]|uniref:Serpin domain-containing protein n=1 Tax=Liquidambar formosana TaxID=63359 RepID=A0AAP0RC31_LIQFO
MNFCLQVVKQTLLKEAEKGFKRNIACSPLSINALSNMLAVGSKGKTLEQFLGFLGSKSVADLNKQSMKLMAAASDGGSSQKGGPLLSCVNGVWLDQRFTLKPSFLQILKSVFTAETKAVDFFNKEMKRHTEKFSVDFIHFTLASA